MKKTLPLASHEVRWFFEGELSHEHPLRFWFKTAAPLQKNPNLSEPEWKGRLGDKPDVYLVVPGSDDIGIKWREGELQIKGRVSWHGIQIFGERHQGNVERWVKWSYKELPKSYMNLFMEDKESEIITVSVKKTRTQRKICLDRPEEEPIEVSTSEFVTRGLNIELTDLEVLGKPFFSLAFEAFPDDSGIYADFAKVVQAFLQSLKVPLSANESLSYPGWLTAVAARIRV
ncbi:hypothetical protein L0244_40705 [bacterium]|nr:hypothetical protein [bacterium]